MTIFCAEELRPAACVVADALVVRGFSVCLQTGPSARRALQLSLATERRGLRVLCVPQALDRKTQRRIHEGLDGDLRGDLLVLPLETPRAVIEAIEARFGVKRSRPRRRYTRAYLAHPTIAESTPGVRRFAGYGLLAAAGTAAVAVLLGATISGSQAMATASTPTPVVVEPERPSLLLDDAVLGAAAPDDVDLDDEPPARRWRRRARQVERLRAELAVEREEASPKPEPSALPEPSAPPEPEEVIVIEDDEPAATPPTLAVPPDVPAEAPLEDEPTIEGPPAQRELVAPPMFGRGAPGLPTRRTRLQPVDPFASNPVE